jgi:hypothetical protein
MLGGERTFTRIAPDIAGRYGVRFDQNMIFDVEVTEDELVVAVISVANAAKTAVEPRPCILRPLSIQTIGHFYGADLNVSTNPSAFSAIA